MREKILVTRSSMPSFEEYIDEIRPLWDTHWLTNMGVKHQELETQLKDYLSVPNISLFSNGHMALELAIQAMGLKGEVITTPFTFASTTHAIVRNGLEPVFCDINSEDCTIDVTKIEGLINDRTSAIIPVHVYGNVCNVEEIERIAKKYELKVIYDAAHTFGVKYKGRGIGCYGDASIYSFHATKVFNTIEGGAVSFKDEEFGLNLYRLKNFGIRGPEVVDGVGANAKMNEFQAAMGICNLRHIDKEIEKRRKVYERYIDNLSNIDGIKVPFVQNDVFPNFSYFPIIFDNKAFCATRNEVYNNLLENNIVSRKYFYPLTNTFECFHGKYDVGLTPIALNISKRVLTLPLFSELRIEDVDNICKIILNTNK
ncbi:DegT/DnrJ/EryC1/StrS family aminotransferase [Acetivibrio cellulolyticus]|uniref:DegT/DnrJ/EryC1/StrS family aminotransferase n=1 Tax=Acetivibrio cellulolyticus TaxID=35830 RepID=UPI0001E2EC12|nr:DegT/DnrJ/EryC1/StrS family aminotransferase [Acetivibrio cellulolyticus]